MAEARGFYKDLIAAYFNDATGNPFQATDGQADIFKLVYEPEYTRAGIRCITQYGKSDVTSMALDKIVNCM